MDTTTETRWCGISVQHQPHDDRPDGAPACPGWGELGEVGRELEALRKGADRLRYTLEVTSVSYESYPMAFGRLEAAVQTFLHDATEAREAEAHQSDQA